MPDASPLDRCPASPVARSSSDRLIHVAVSWEENGALLWSRSDAPGARPWTGEEPRTIADALDAVIAHVEAVTVRLRQPSVTFGFALVEVA